MSRNQYKHLTWYSAEGTETAVVSVSDLSPEPATQPVSAPVETRQVIANVEPYSAPIAPPVETRQVIANVEPYSAPIVPPVEPRQVIANVETYDDYRKRIQSETPIIVDGSPLIIPRVVVGGGGGGAMQPSKPSGNVALAKPSFLKRNLIPIILIGSAVFILIKKPIN
jgi:hypothetical protein